MKTSQRVGKEKQGKKFVSSTVRKKKGVCEFELIDRFQSKIYILVAAKYSICQGHPSLLGRRCAAIRPSPQHSREQHNETKDSIYGPLDGKEKKCGSWYKLMKPREELQFTKADTSWPIMPRVAELCAQFRRPTRIIRTCPTASQTKSCREIEAERYSRWFRGGSKRGGCMR